MKNQLILWLASIVLVFLVGYLKNITDKDYPITGTFGIEGEKVSYKLDKVSCDKTAYKNIIISDVKGIKGELIWIKDSISQTISYREIERGLECEIPRLNPGEKINYKINLIYRDKTFVIPQTGFITLTFWGIIPFGVSFLTFILIYGGLIMSFRCLLELINKNKNLKKYAVITCALFITLTSIVIPLRNSYKLGAINNYIPQISDLLEPVLLIILLNWVAGTILIFNEKYEIPTMIFLAAVTLVLFFLPGW